jgi:hypothetical protein
MVAQIAGGGQKGWPAILVAGITGNALQRGERGPNLRTIVARER